MAVADVLHGGKGAFCSSLLVRAINTKKSRNEIGECNSTIDKQDRAIPIAIRTCALMEAKNALKEYFWPLWRDRGWRTLGAWILWVTVMGFKPESLDWKAPLLCTAYFAQCNKAGQQHYK